MFIISTSYINVAKTLICKHQSLYINKSVYFNKKLSHHVKYT